MSDVFFKDLKLPTPHINLGVGSGTHAQQTGRVMIEYEKVLMQQAPDLIVVVGDVNSTIAATLAGVKLGIKVAHLEAGLRSFDRNMPEEINRIATDALSDILWTPSVDADENLKREGVSDQKICRVGNIMIDSLEMLKPTISAVKNYEKYNVEKRHYGIVTLHRPSNVDDKDTLKMLCKNMVEISKDVPLIFPVHPRTKKRLEEYQLMNDLSDANSIILTEPLNYISFMSLVFDCCLVITDSGGIQEETSYLGIPCFTLRPNTERPITIERGTNQLCSLETVMDSVVKALTNGSKKKCIIEMWDGKTAERIVNYIEDSII